MSIKAQNQGEKENCRVLQPFLLFVFSDHQNLQICFLFLTQGGRGGRSFLLKPKLKKDHKDQFQKQVPQNLQHIQPE